MNQDRGGLKKMFITLEQVFLFIQNLLIIIYVCIYIYIYIYINI